MVVQKAGLTGTQGSRAPLSNFHQSLKATAPSHHSLLTCWNYVKLYPESGAAKCTVDLSVQGLQPPDGPMVGVPSAVKAGRR